MTTVSIFALPDDKGGRSYLAVSGDRQGDGRTAGEALDSITAQIDQPQSSTLVVLQNRLPDQFFSSAQCDRLEELMARWRTARDQGVTLCSAEQSELDSLVDAELRAAGKRAEAMADEFAK